MAEYQEGNISLESTDALDDEGYVLMLASTGKVAKATDGSPAFGVNFTSTKDPVTGTATANKQVAVVQAPKYARVQYHIAQNGESIAIGDIVSVKGAAASGKVLRHVATLYGDTYNKIVSEAIADENACIVGIALEAITASAAAAVTGKLKVKLLCPLPVKQAASS